MYKVGDEVLVKGKIVGIEGISTTTYNVEFLDILHETACVSDKCVTDKTYADGLNDAWELAKKIYDMKNDAIEEIFGVNGGFYEVIRNFTFEDCRDRIEAYEDSRKINVGDVVECPSEKHEGIVTYLLEKEVYIIWSDGSCGQRRKADLKKTGRTAEGLADLLRQIGE